MSDGAELKLGRAHEHIAEADKIVQDWLRSQAFTTERIRDVSTARTEVRVRLTEAPPERLALIVGDAVHNLRAALDHAVFDAASRHVGGELAPKVEEALMFPVVGDGTRADFDAAAKRRLVGVPEPVRDVIEDAQPYHWTDAENPDGYCFHAVWQVHELDRIDKHRRLTVTAAALDHHGIGIPDGVDPDVKFFMASGPVRDGQVLATYLGAEAGVQYLFDRNVVVIDGGIGVRDAAVVTLLNSLLRYVEWVVWRMRAASASSG